MPDEPLQPPYEFALSKFRQRIEQDTTLPASIKDAILADLSSDSPASLAALWSALHAEEDKNEASGA
jgi:hypothetical protein